MLKLVLMRHAKSSHADRGLSDHDRPLNDRGRCDAPVVAQHLVERELGIDLVLASTALRVQQTLELMSPHFAGQNRVDVAHLYLAMIDDLKQIVLEYADHHQSIMLVGHNPGLSELASQLALGFVDLPTAAVVAFECDADDWKTAFRSGIWRSVLELRPKELPG